MKKAQIAWNKYTPFQQRVFRAIFKIPKGQVWTYGQVAKKIRNPQAARAVGMALSKNQDAPFIPCHRVVGHDGKMVGYSGKGGIASKIKLLKKEGYNF